MTEENKQLLFKALCMYYPHNLKVMVEDKKREIIIMGKGVVRVDLTRFPFSQDIFIEEVKPILYDLSALKEEELDFIWFELVSTDNDAYDRDDLEGMMSNHSCQHLPYFIIKYLHSKHYDTEGLIDKGLAINKNDIK